MSLLEGIKKIKDIEDEALEEKKKWCWANHCWKCTNDGCGSATAKENCRNHESYGKSPDKTIH